MKYFCVDGVITLGPGPGALCVAMKMLDGLTISVRAKRPSAESLPSPGRLSETGENVLASNPTPPAICRARGEVEL